MKPGLRIGDTYEFEIVVEPGMQAQFQGTLIHPLYSTAAMINHMEWAARQHILPYLEPGEDGCGYHVDVKHLAATPIGETVRIRSTVTAISRSRITSHLEAWNSQAKIGNGSLVQAIVPLSRLRAVEPAEAEDIDADTEDLPLNPPPASLVSEDGRTRFQLEVLRWETGILPCTRYDEWLVCRAKLSTPNHLSPITQEGAFLLRYELEEWREALNALIAGSLNNYQSDFLEPIFKIALTPTNQENWSCALSLQMPHYAESRANATLHPSLDDLARFTAELDAQLEGFPSRL